MKKRNVFLTILIPIFLIGIICILAGIAMGGTLYSYELQTDENGEEYQSNTTTLSSSEAETIHGINYNIRTSDIKIVNGEQYSVSGSGRYRSYIEDGIWYIKTAKRTARITFLNHSIEIPSFWNHSFEGNGNFGQNTITIPSGTNLETAIINVSAGELTGEQLCADNITLKTGAGSCTLEQLTAESLSVKVGAGSTKLQRVQVSDSCTAKVGAGDLVLGSKKIPAGENFITNLHGKCAAGNMTVTGKITGSSRLQCSVGQIDVLLDGFRHNYNIDSQSSLGDIDIQGEDTNDLVDDLENELEDALEDIDDIDDDDYENYTNHHDEYHHDDPAPSFSTNNSGRNNSKVTPAPTSDTTREKETNYGDLSLKCSMGDINIKFQH